MKTREKRLGPTQIVVYNYLRGNGPMTAAEVGEALYDTTSSCSEWSNTVWPKEKIRRRWASKVIRMLIKLGKVEMMDGKPVRYKAIV